MYNKTLTAALAVAILGSGATFAADKPGADWISLEQAVEKAKAAGYTELHGIEADDDGWEGEGMKQDGKKYACAFLSPGVFAERIACPLAALRSAATCHSAPATGGSY